MDEQHPETVDDATVTAVATRLGMSAEEVLQRIAEQRAGRLAQRTPGHSTRASQRDGLYGIGPSKLARPFRGSQKMVQLGSTGVTGGSSIAEHLLKELDGKDEDAAREVIANVARMPLNRGVSRRRDTSALTRLTKREIARVADRLERDPQVRFALIRWAASNDRGVPGPDEWYIALCVKHNLHPVTGAKVAPWRRKDECVARLVKYGAPWADILDPGTSEPDVLTIFGRYVYYVRFGDHAFGHAKWKTLEDAALRWEIWGIAPDDEDAVAYVRKLQQKWIADRGLV